MTARHMICFFQVRGKGTRRMAELRPGDKVRVWGPLGNGFVMEPDTPTLLLAGGMGIVPFVGYVSEHLKPWNVSMLFGHREHISCYPVDSINEHIPVGVISNGLDRVTDQRIEVEEGASRGHLNTILQSLARIELSKERTSFYDIVEKEIYKKNDKVTYIVISTSQRKESAEIVERLAEEAGKIMWLLPLTKSMEVKLKEYSNIDFIRIVHE